MAVAREHGLRAGEPAIIEDSSNTLVHLRPAPVVARVATGTAAFRPGGAWLAREVAVCTHLAAHGAPAVRPSAELPPGPHERDGLFMTFLELIDVTPAPVDPRAVGEALRVVHETLTSFDGELPALMALDDVERMVPVLRAQRLLDADADALLRRSAQRSRERVEALGLALQPLHGDSHLQNTLPSADGPIWIDFEDAFLGPVGWDLACLVAPGRDGAHDPEPLEAALDAYGADSIDPDALDVLVEARGVQVAAWTVALAPRIPRIRGRVDHWLGLLRDRDV